MKKSLIVLTALAAFALVAAPWALAAGHGKPQGRAHHGQAKPHRGALGREVGEPRPATAWTRL